MTGYARVDMASVAPLLPADKVAGRVASRGEHFEWAPTLPSKVHSAEPLITRAPTPQELGQPQFVDLKGVKIGRLTVIGIAADVISKTGTNWVVRCVCGSYETRKARYVKACKGGNNPGNEDPMCDWCGNTRKLQLGLGRNFEKQKARGEDFAPRSILNGKEA